MDDDDKMKDVVDLSKKIFLREIVREIKKGGKPYNLDEEFVKTKKNRRFIVLLVIIGFIALFAGAAVGITQIIQKQSRVVKVSISDFRDVNLRDVLDVAKKNESEMEIAQRELTDLRAERDAKILEITQDTGQKIEIISNEKLSDSARNEKIREIKLAERSAIEEIQNDYNERIMILEEEIVLIQERINAYDARLIEQAREQEEIFNNQARLFEIKMDNTISYYEEKIDELTGIHKQELQSVKTHQEELIALLKKNHADEIERLTLKYNPIFTSERIDEILEREISDEIFTLSPLKKYQKTLYNEGVFSRAEFSNLRARLSDITLLIDRLQEIPYINSVPNALSHIGYLAYVIVDDYEKLWNKLVKVVEGKNARIAEQNAVIAERNAVITEQKTVIGEQEVVIDYFQYSLDFLTRKNRENGYILDPRDPQRLIVYLNKIHRIQDGDLGYVFRNDDEFIATIRFHITNEAVTASLTELGLEDKPIEPFDRILIQIQ